MREEGAAGEEGAMNRAPTSIVIVIQVSSFLAASYCRAALAGGGAGVTRRSRRSKSAL